MKSRRLWPVTTALVVLMSGSISIEVLARLRDPSLERVEISSTRAASEEDEPEAGEAQFGSPLGPEHARARELARRHELSDAARVLAEVSAIHPSHGLLRAEEGHLLLRLSRPQEALPLLESSARQLTDNPIVQQDLGLCLAALDRNDEAKATLRAGLSLRPNHSGLRITLGELLRREGDIDAALEVLEPATQQGSNDERSQALASLGRCYVAKGDTSKARQLFEESVQRAPASVNTWVRVARGLLQSEELADQQSALEYAVRAARLAPELPLVHSLLGRVHEKLAQPKDAMVAYREAVRLDPDYAYARRRLLRLALDADDYRQARQQAEALLRASPDVAEHHFLAGLVAARSGDLDSAREYYEAAIKRAAGTYPEALYNLGILERQAKRPEQAIAAYERAIEQRPNFRAAYNNLGLVHLERGAVVQAETAFRKALDLDPKYVAAWTNLARSLSAQQKPEDAVRAYQRAATLGDPSRALSVDLAVALRKAGRPEEAIALYRHLLDGDPRYVTGWYNLGIALEAVGQDNEAKQSYERALQLDPEHLKALKNLAQLEAKTGLTELARVHLTDALDRDPVDRQLRLELAQLLWDERDFAGCSHAARLVLAQTPDDVNARALLNRCARQ